MTKNKTARDHVVLLDNTGSTIPGPCYLGSLDRGIQCGVRHLENATRYTKVGAKRVAASFRNARAELA